MVSFRRTLVSVAVPGVAALLSLASPLYAEGVMKGGLNRFVGCPGDIDGDGIVGQSDIKAIDYTSSELGALDVNGDGMLSSRDKRAVAGFRGMCAQNADFNGDGIVDGYDLGELLGAFGADKAGSPYDLSGDGVVDESDVALLESAWGGLLSFQVSRLDTNRDGRITGCDAVIAHPRFGSQAPRADVNADGVRDFDDYNLVVGFMEPGTSVSFKSYERRCRGVGVKKGSRRR